MSSNTTRFSRTCKAAVAGVSLSLMIAGYHPMAEARQPDGVSSSMKDTRNASKPSAADRKLVNKRDHDGMAPIVYAIAGGDLALVKELIARGADVNARNNAGMTPLLYAIIAGNCEVARLLVENKADVNAKKGDDGTTPLMLAVINDRTLTDGDASNIAELLIAHKASVNARDKQGRTALMYAAFKARAAVAGVLVGSKADANIKDKQGRTALMEAASDEKAEVFQLLLTYGKAKTDIKDKHGRTALMEAAANKQMIAARILLADHADVNARDNEGRTALDLASDTSKMTAAEFHSYGIPFSHPEARNAQMADLLRSYGAE